MANAAVCTSPWPFTPDRAQCGRSCTRASTLIIRGATSSSACRAREQTRLLPLMAHWLPTCLLSCRPTDDPPSDLLSNSDCLPPRPG
eukprot:6176787-Pleurochrysis_carterae.AAC.1